MIITNRPKRNKPSDFVDKQVLILISDHQHEEPCLSDLLAFARKEMPAFRGDEDTIRHSIDRLEKRGKIATKYVIRRGKACRVPYLV